MQNLHPRRRAPLALIKTTLNKFGRSKNKEDDSFRTVDLFFINDREIRRLKREFLGIDRATDVMAFPGEKKHLGDVFISLDTACRQASQRKIPLAWELILLSVHGLLHLRGLRDENISDWKKMRVAEFEALVRLLN